MSQFNINFERILFSIEEVTGIHPDLVKSKQRQREIVEARAMFYIIAYRNGYLPSLTTVGKYINRDHATVIHGRKLHQDLYHTDRDYVARFAKVYEHYFSRVEMEFFPVESFTINTF